MKLPVPWPRRNVLELMYNPGRSGPIASSVSADLVWQFGSIDVHVWNFSADSAQALTGPLAYFALSVQIQVCNVARWGPMGRTHRSQCFFRGRRQSAGRMAPHLHLPPDPSDRS